jgi:hypothetical protein
VIYADELYVVIGSSVLRCTPCAKLATLFTSCSLFPDRSQLSANKRATRVFVLLINLQFYRCGFWDCRHKFTMNYTRTLSTDHLVDALCTAVHPDVAANLDGEGTADMLL